MKLLWIAAEFATAAAIVLGITVLVLLARGSFATGWYKMGTVCVVVIPFYFGALACLMDKLVDCEDGL